MTKATLPIRLTKLLVASTVSAALFSSTALAGDINTFPAWNGTTFISSYGEPNTATYGQTITPDATQRILRSFTFTVFQTSGVAPQSQAFVFQWDPVNNRIVGPALFSSALFPTPAGASFQTIDISTGNIVLVPGTQYVLFLTTSTAGPQANAAYRWGSVGNNTADAGGRFVFRNNSDDFSLLSTSTWSFINQDLAFMALFAPPLPTGQNLNQQAVATAVQNGFNANPGGTPDPFLFLTDADLTIISGEISTAAVSAGLHSADLFVQQMSDPFITQGGTAVPTGDVSTAYSPLEHAGKTANLTALAALGAEVTPASEVANDALLSMSGAHAADPVDVALGARWKMWGAAYGGAQDIDGDPFIVGSSNVRVRNWGVATGFDRAVGDGHYGLSLGGSGSTFNLANGLGSGSAGVFNAGIYGTHNFGNAYVSAALAYAWNSVRTSRIVGADTLSGSFNAHTLSARAEAGYRFDTAFAAITPYAAVQGSSYFIPGYAETSSGATTFALAYGRQTEAFIRTELGARFEHAFPMTNGAIKLSARAAWAYNATTARAVTAAFQSLPGQSFTVNGAAPARHSALVDLGIEAAFDNGISAKLSFNGEFSNNVKAYGASAKLTYRW